MTLVGKELKASFIFKNLVLIVAFPCHTATEECVPKQIKALRVLVGTAALKRSNREVAS